jgi:DNA-directed RNA polymerase specialized sigma24 family protein
MAASEGQRPLVLNWGFEKNPTYGALHKELGFFRFWFLDTLGATSSPSGLAKRHSFSFFSVVWRGNIDGLTIKRRSEAKITKEVGGSVTRWIGGLKVGDPDAAQRLWERYFTELVRLARARLRTVPRAAEDEEDVAQSAFVSFCAAASHGRFPQLDDRDDLWRVLVTLAQRKAADLIRRQRRLKRGSGKVAKEADVVGPEGQLFSLIAGTAPTPSFAATVADEYRYRLDQLGDDALRRVAVLKMEGCSNQEIAVQLGLGLRSVVRKLDLIRRTWQASR